MKLQSLILLGSCLVISTTLKAASITLVNIDEVDYSFGGSTLAPNPATASYFGDKGNPHKGGYTPSNFNNATESGANPAFTGLVGYNFTNFSITAGAQRSVDNGTNAGHSFGAADVTVRATFKVASTNGTDAVDVYLTSVLDGLLKATVNTANVSNANAVGTFRTPTVDRYYKEAVTSDGVNTPQYTWSIYDGKLPVDQRLQNVNTPGNGFLGPLGTQTSVFYSSGPLPYLIGVASGTNVSVSLYLSAGVDVTGANAAAMSDFYHTGSAILTVADHPAPEPATYVLFGAGLLGMGLIRRKSHPQV